MESRAHAFDMAGALKEACDKAGVGLIYKTSFDKANRSSASTARGVGLEVALPIFNDIRKNFGVPVLTDVHERDQCAAVAQAVDVLQIPAFLSRQTDLLVAAAHTGKCVNVKKGQFLSPRDMKNVIAKITGAGNPNVFACERGASFGYNTLVSDMRALPVLAEIGCPYALVRDAAGLQEASRIILPGVGHFGQMMRSLDAMNVRQPLLDRIRGGVPFLGICLGMQALFESSEEAPEAKGLGLYPGVVRRFAADARVPHMGWNELEPCAGSRLMSNLPPRPFVYFAHSYYVPLNERAAATCTYTVPYTAALESGNVFGVQFHPEKSAAVGQRIVRNFLEAEC